MKVLADRYLYKINEFIPGSADLTLFDPDKGLPKDVIRYDALLVRTVIPLNRRTLPENGNIRFIGTASAGFDHLDLDYLKSMGIHCANSAGCNANAVAEYIITVMYRWAEERNTDLTQKRIGIIGHGNTGGKLSSYLQKLNLNTVIYDPPKEDLSSTFLSASLDELLQCDILSFHTPLTVSGPHPTKHMCDSLWLKNGFDLIINAARGGVVSENDLLACWSDGLIKDFVLDVWEGEPFFSDEMAGNAFIATPHIAGYSKEAKKRATEMIVTQLSAYFGLEYHSSADTCEDNKQAGTNRVSSFARFLWKHHKIKDYDRELRKLIGRNYKEKGYQFAKLRSETELRFEFRTKADWFDGKSIPEEFGVFR